jgi:hypothetical protein
MHEAIAAAGVSLPRRNVMRLVRVFGPIRG